MRRSPAATVIPGYCPMGHGEPLMQIAAALDTRVWASRKPSHRCGHSVTRVPPELLVGYLHLCAHLSSVLCGRYCMYVVQYAIPVFCTCTVHTHVLWYRNFISLAEARNARSSLRCGVVQNSENGSACRERAWGPFSLVTARPDKSCSGN